MARHPARPALLRFGWMAAVVAALLTGGCADTAEPLQEAVCDDQRPCAFGAICVGGFCTPPPLDAQRLDLAPPADGGAPADRGAPPDAARPDAAAPPDRGPVGDAGPVSDAGRAPDGGAPIDAGPAPDLGPAPDMGLPDDCGRFGQVCCPGDLCFDGGCLEGTCAAFGGVYAFGGIDGVSCTARNPLNRDRCTCPPGFEDHPLEDVDFDESDGLGIFHTVYVCAPVQDDPQADLRGAFAVASDPTGQGCPDGCRLGPLQPQCACPAGTDAISFDGVRQLFRGADWCPRQITFCAGGDPFSFGGAYRRFRPETVACQEIAGPALCQPNPRTGDCSCPDGFVEATVGMMAAHPERGPPFFCRADMVVCMATP